VLQVADARHVPDGSGLSPAPEQRYRLDLSDGVHLQPGTLAASLNHLVRDGALRRGSVVHVLDFNCDYRRRTIVIIQLQILQPECALIGSLKLYEPTRKSCGFSTRSIRYAPRPDCEPYYGGQHIHQSGIASEAEERTYHGPFGGSSLPGRDTPCSLDLPAEPAAWKTVGQIKDEYLGYFDRPYFITVKADISFIGTEHFYCYAACPLVVNGKRCNVEASSNVDGMWHGKRHGQRCGRSFGFCDSGYLVHIQIQDHTGTTSATAYGKAAKEIFGCTAKDLYLLEYEEQDYKQLDDIILGAVSKQFVLKLKVQAKPYSDARRMKCVVLKAEKVNPSAESCRLREAIDAHFGDCLGSCLEFGSSMPTYSSLSDLKGCSAAQSSNSSHTISPGRARQLCSADGYRQQVNEFYMEPSTLSAFGACGWGHDHRSDIDGQRSSAPDGFMGRFHGASPGVNIALDMRPMVLSHRQSANLCAGD